MGFYFQSSSQQNFSCAHWFLLSPAVTLCWIHMAFLSIGTTQTRKPHQGELICIFWQSYLIDWPRGVGKILFPTLMHCTELKHLFLSFKFLPIIHRNGWPLVVKFKGLFSVILNDSFNNVISSPSRIRNGTNQKLNSQGTLQLLIRWIECTVYKMRKKCFSKTPRFVLCILLEILSLCWATNEAWVPWDAITEDFGSQRRAENSAPF